MVFIGFLQVSFRALQVPGVLYFSILIALSFYNVLLLTLDFTFSLKLIKLIFYSLNVLLLSYCYFTLFKLLNFKLLTFNVFFFFLLVYLFF